MGSDALSAVRAAVAKFANMGGNAVIAVRVAAAVFANMENNAIIVVSVTIISVTRVTANLGTSVICAPS